MKRRGGWQTGIAAVTAAALLTASVTMRTEAQSEFSGGQGFPYNAFDRLPAIDIDVKGGVIHLAFAPGRIELPNATIVEWVTRSAKAITTYYGRFPVKSARILIVPSNGARVQGGTTWGYRGGAIRIVLGSNANEDDLRRDWVMVHEMVHLALPDIEERYAWLSEGLAVYIEPIARVQSGDLPAAGVWAAMIRDMPKGLPGLGDRGLDNTSAWGRKYWGGAIYCLLADVEIRKRTGNRMGLQDAMRGVVATGGSHEVDWPMTRVLSVADTTIGLSVLEELHAQMGSKFVYIDLDALWRELGLKSVGDTVEYDDTAPLSTLRSSVMENASKDHSDR
ncbi:MAG: hypothetical protein HY242_10495 [Afipia sp.]|nr:hypothetical protein [Afipia sp.]